VCGKFKPKGSLQRLDLAVAQSSVTTTPAPAPTPASGPDPRFLDPALDRTSIRPDGPIDRAELLAMYRAMRMARTFEHKLSALYRQGKIVGAVYLGMGQEAIATGVVSLLRERDYFSTVARGLAGWFMRGIEPRHVMARWLGRDVPPGHGRELGLFLADLKQYGMAPYHNGSMASWIPSGAGFALAFKYRREPRVYAALTGDGATSPGDFYEGLNFAAIHKLPLVIFVENNCFAYSTPTNLQMPVANVADRAPAFNIPAALRLAYFCSPPPASALARRASYSFNSASNDIRVLRSP